ncbi:MAG: DnaJ domain-containing protein [candidate division KSB1 bacterium]|nr:DnaJ domain-containing protein [candidate division KSB1 bacterium]MDZ7273206.1 DnaJ domain-containing protein [candidate division KSB1 bacterium]MDZ7285308.1 DnaJ domain-containing protein [candidate division KSB1 bacterium]MDZ7298340.1 DnaJ domain-containing protein [candidate division KSB1 bacterium]MDZ7349027.1 DnaJ domain-containing protein [candidate division KSB1 bacterium]
MAKNYYVILGVAADATQEQIKSAYRQLAMRYHPDYYGEDAGPFLAIQEAYSVLGNPGRRLAYDLMSHKQELPAAPAAPVTEVFRESVTEVPRPPRTARVEPLVPEQDHDTIGRISMQQSFQTFLPSFDEIFDRLWSNFRSLERPAAERSESLQVEIPITPLQAWHGGLVRILVPARARCPMCRGAGWLGPHECWRCGGEGGLSGEFPVFIDLPAGTPDNYTVRISLRRYGNHNFYLTAIFKVSGKAG